MVVRYVSLSDAVECIILLVGTNINYLNILDPVSANHTAKSHNDHKMLD